jgi:hypothetical protein
MLAPIVYLDLVGLPEADASAALLGAFSARNKPSSALVSLLQQVTNVFHSQMEMIECDYRVALAIRSQRLYGVAKRQSPRLLFLRLVVIFHILAHRLWPSQHCNVPLENGHEDFGFAVLFKTIRGLCPSKPWDFFAFDFAPAGPTEAAGRSKWKPFFPRFRHTHLARDRNQKRPRCCRKILDEKAYRPLTAEFSAHIRQRLYNELLTTRHYRTNLSLE